MSDPSFDPADLKLSDPPASMPADYWILVTNSGGPGQTFIVLPQSGNLWLFYEWSLRPASFINVWHQGGSTTPVQPGQNTIPVSAGDGIWYGLQDPANDSIKIGYQYT